METLKHMKKSYRYIADILRGTGRTFKIIEQVLQRVQTVQDNTTYLFFVEERVLSHHAQQIRAYCHKYHLDVRFEKRMFHFRKQNHFLHLRLSTEMPECLPLTPENSFADHTVIERWIEQALASVDHKIHQYRL